MRVKSMTITIDNFDNAAMVDDRSGEVCRMLRGIIKSIEEYGVPNADGMRLKDTNGNTVGTVSVDFEEDAEEWDGDTSDVGTIQSFYGSGNTPCEVYWHKDGWYAVHGSMNINRAPYGTEFEDGLMIEEIMDTDMVTAGPVNSEEDLARIIWEHEHAE